MIYRIHPDRLDDYWDSLKPLIESTIDNEYTIESIYHYLKRGKMFTLVLVNNNNNGIDAALIGQIMSYPNQKQLKILNMGMNILGYKKELDQALVSLAHTKDIDVLVCQVDSGLARVLTKDCGYKSKHRIIIKEV